MSASSRAFASISGRTQPGNFHSHVIRNLGVAIVRGQYPEQGLLPGDAELMEVLGVSRTVLREALKTLSAKGMIEARARIGTKVLPRERWNLFDQDVLSWHFEAGPDIAFLRSLAEIRLAIEPEAAAHAALRRTDEQADTLFMWVDRMAATGNSLQSFAQSDLQFHRTVADASGNPFMRSISALVELALTSAFSLSSPEAEMEAFTVTLAIHRSIAMAIRDGDPEAARQTMRQAVSEGLNRAERIFG